MKKITEEEVKDILEFLKQNDVEMIKNIPKGIDPNNLFNVKGIYSNLKGEYYKSSYWENHISDIMTAFMHDKYLNHPLTTALCQLIGQEINFTPHSLKVLRESTGENTRKRIDIIIVTDTFVICIENKLWSKCTNEFNVYKETIENDYPDRKYYYRVLRPKTDSNDCKKCKIDRNVWECINYRELSKKAKGIRLARKFDDKWSKLYNDFLAYLEKMEGTMLEDKDFKIIMKNYPVLCKVESLLNNNFIPTLYLKTAESIAEKLKCEIKRDDNMFVPENHKKLENVSIYLYYNKDGRFFVYVGIKGKKATVRNLIIENISKATKNIQDAEISDVIVDDGGDPYEEKGVVFKEYWLSDKYQKNIPEGVALFAEWLCGLNIQRWRNT